MTIYLTDKQFTFWKIDYLTDRQFTFWKVDYLTVRQFKFWKIDFLTDRQFKFWKIDYLTDDRQFTFWKIDYITDRQFTFWKIDYMQNKLNVEAPSVVDEWEGWLLDTDKNMHIMHLYSPLQSYPPFLSPSIIPLYSPPLPSYKT